MGVYDSVLFRCPRCQAEIEYQTKAGDCHLKDYDMAVVPVKIAVAIEGDPIVCPHCSNQFTIAVDAFMSRNLPLYLKPNDHE